MVQKLGAVFPPNPATLTRVADWLSDHPGATLDEVAAGIFPGKVTGPGRTAEILRTLAGVLEKTSGAVLGRVRRSYCGGTSSRAVPFLRYASGKRTTFRPSW